MAGVYDPPYPIPYNPIRGTTSAPAGVMTVYNVKDYGVYGDGIHNDSIAGNNCIAAAAAVGGTAYFPEGTYLGQFTTPIQSTGYVRIMGAGIDATTFIAAATQTASDPVLSLAMPGEVVDCTIDGNGTVVPNTTTYNVLAAGNGLDAGWDYCALRRVRARNMNPNSNGWNLVVWMSNSANPLITTLVLEDVIVEGPSSQGQDAMSIVGFDTCYVNNMSFLNLYRSPNFYFGNALIAKGIYSNGAQAIGEVVFDSGVKYVSLSGYKSADTSGPEALLGAPFVVASNCYFGAGYVVGYDNNNQVAYFENVIAPAAGHPSNPHIYNTMGLWLASDCTFGQQIEVLAATTGPLHFVNCNWQVGVPAAGLFDGSSGTPSVEVQIDGGITNVTGSIFQSGCTPAAGSRISHLTGYNPVGSSVPGTAFALPASGTAWTNNTGVDGTLYVTTAGTVTDVVVQGVTVGSSLAVGQQFHIPAGGTFTLTYSAAPTLVFVGN